MTRPSRRFFVVTPILNGAKFLAQALHSIDAQGCPDWMHVVVDGGSSDGSVEMVQASIQGESRRRLIQGEDRGMYDALFKGFEAFATENPGDDDIFLWLNADDRLAPWAFDTMRQAFDILDAQWVTGLPGQWDAQGRLVLVQPSGWYPRWCIARGWFNGRCLGWIQQESTFFTARLLRQLSPGTIEKIRATKMAGDFLLWRDFARFEPLRAAPTLIGGFRAHGANISIHSGEVYRRELDAHGAFTPPPFLGRAMRLFYRIATAVVSSMQARHPLV